METNLGTSAFKISLAVKDKNNNYLLAIECDGENYKNATTTRERERLRCENLERYGWNYLRVWSVDWFLNKKHAKEKLLKELTKIQTKNNSQQATNESSACFDNFISTSTSNNI